MQEPGVKRLTMLPGWIGVKPLRYRHIGCLASFRPVEKKGQPPGLSIQQQRGLIDLGHPHLSVRRQCELLGLNRSTLYYQPATETEENLELMRLIDRQYTDRPYYGSRRMTAWLQERGYPVNRKRVQRLMGVMVLEAIYPRPKLSVPGQGARIYPYLLRGVKIERPDQVWSTDITYIGLPGGFMYLAAIIDWFSRYVIAWRLSNTLEVGRVDVALVCFLRSYQNCYASSAPKK